MRCENEFCIYQTDNNCILNNIELDINGTCLSCILIQIPNETLNEFKNKALYNINNR